MALTKYNPNEEGIDSSFIEKVSQLYVNEPAKLKLSVANRTLWSLYAMGYANTPLLARLSDAIA